MPAPQNRSRLPKTLLLFGFVALALAIYTAHDSPPAGYELSIYTATPPVFWAGIAIALAVSLLVSVLSRRTDRYLGYFLAGSAMTAVLGLPLLRGYTFYGHGDPMTHLGWLRDITMGKLALPELFYPGLHSVALTVSHVTGNTLAHSLLLAVLLFSLPVLVFVPLVVRTATADSRAVPVGLFAAALLLPITNLSTFNRAHPYTQTIFFSTLVVYLALRVLFQDRATLLTPSSLLLVLASLTLVVSHPLQALNILLLFLGIVAVQFWFDGEVAGQQPLVYHTVVLGIFFTLWTVGTDTFESASRTYLPAVLSYFQGTAEAGSTVAAQSGSLAELGVSTEQLLVKLFGVSLVFVTIAAIFVLANIYSRFRTALSGRQRLYSYGALGSLAVGPSLFVLGLTQGLLSTVTGLILFGVTVVTGAGMAVLAGLFLLSRASTDGGASQATTTDAVVTYLVVGSAFTVPLFGIFFIGNIAELYFRVLGHLLLLVTILGSIALLQGRQQLDELVPTVGSDTLLVLLFALLLPMAIIGIYSSPYIYQANQHVPGEQFQGFETTFGAADPSIPVAGIRSGPSRYSDGIAGVAASQPRPVSIAGQNLTRLQAATPGPVYLAVAEYNRQREIGAFRELRYTRAQFQSLDHQRGVSVVQATGDYRLYYAR